MKILEIVRKIPDSHTKTSKCWYYDFKERMFPKKKQILKKGIYLHLEF